MSSLYTPTRADIRNRTRFFIDEPTQANFTDSDINYAINRAQHRVALELIQVGEKFLVNATPTIITPDGINWLFALADDFWVMIRLEWVATGQHIDIVDINDPSFESMGIPPLVNFTGIGDSAKAAIIGNSIGIKPMPLDSSMTMQYWYAPVLLDLEQDTDTSPIPIQFLDMLAIASGMDCQTKDEDDTSQLQLLWNDWIDKLKRAARQRQTQTPKHVRRTQARSTDPRVIF